MTELTRLVGSDPVAGMVAALFATAAAFSAQGEELELYKKKGWLSSKREWVDAATKLRGLATQLENYGARGPGWTIQPAELLPDEPAASGHYAPGTEPPAPSGMLVPVPANMAADPVAPRRSLPPSSPRPLRVWRTTLPAPRTSTRSSHRRRARHLRSIRPRSSEHRRHPRRPSPPPLRHRLRTTSRIRSLSQKVRAGWSAGSRSRTSRG
jgi:hypothetical protein